MAITRWDMSKATESEKKSSVNDDSMTLNEIVNDLAKKNPFLKTPMKRRREEKEEVSAGEKRLVNLIFETILI